MHDTYGNRVRVARKQTIGTLKTAAAALRDRGLDRVSPGYLDSIEHERTFPPRRLRRAYFELMRDEARAMLREHEGDESNTARLLRRIAGTTEDRLWGTKNGRRPRRLRTSPDAEWGRYIREQRGRRT